MTEYRVLVSCPLIMDSMEDFEAQLISNGIRYDVADVDQQLSEAELLEVIEDYDGILAGDDELTEAVIERGDRLKVISKWGIGIDSIDREAAAENGVEVFNTPGAFAAEVADVVIGYSIMLTRELHRIDAAVRSGDWHCPRGTSLAGKTFGIIGVGNIGEAVARRANALGMQLLGFDIEPIDEELRRETGIERVELEELLRRSTVVSLNCALTDVTRGMIGEHELKLIGPDGYLINSARGELVDESDLVSALETDQIKGAALDVFHREPLPKESPLTGLDNVVLGSHNAQNTAEAVARVNERAIENLIEGLVG